MWGGSAYTVAPIYLCEIAEPEVRGALNTLFILMAYVGIMFEYWIGTLAQRNDGTLSKNSYRDEKCYLTHTHNRLVSKELNK